MAYSDFTLEKVKKTFNLNIIEELDIFTNVKELKASESLTNILNNSIPIALASNSEKSRSEMIIAPLLLELKIQLKDEINLFSGVDFTVDTEKGLNGICDFLITHSSEKLIITAPVITILEAKKENITGGLGQCIAEMIGAQIFNQELENPPPKIYGAVTTGSIWQFLQIEEQTISIDLREYYLNNVNKILGILFSFIKTTSVGSQKR
jgi:hypothetical protein